MADSVELTASHLSAPARRSIRVVAAARLAAVEAAFAELQSHDDASFHDVRVALRRLRSLLRAFRRELSDTLHGKTRRRLRELAHATNPIREAEVMLEWLAEQPSSFPREEMGRLHLVKRVEKERDAAASDARSMLERRLPKAITKLSEALQGYSEHHSADDGEDESPSMAAAMSDALANAAEHFARAVGRAEASGEPADFHRVRIDAKRLRYLLELIASDEAASALVKQLAGIQDQLGHAHDMHEVAHRIVRELGELGARDGRLVGLRAIEADGVAHETMQFRALEPGLVALAARAHREECAAIAAFDTNAVDAIERAVRDVSDALVAGRVD